MSTFEKVKKIIVSKLGVDEDKVVENAVLTTDLGADSLDSVELVMDIEKEFGIEISDDAAMKISKVKDIVEYIDSKAKAAPAKPAPVAPAKK